ncbi:MAG TPA: hypothetical protein VMW48_04940, partial [Vicinamibacterales bacterium]|nr:hypothetical protein [Vicinamibacterales bacterium]
MRIITSTIWDQWSDHVTSRTDLPRWTESLIRATADIADIRFPSGDAGQLHGFDGRLESSGFLGFVPEGKSVWEFGTSPLRKKTGGKAQEDYDKRTADPQDVDLKS